MTANQIRRESGAGRRLEWGALGVLFTFTVTAILGYGVFALHPNLIPDTDQARRFYGDSFEVFARFHILLSALVMGVALFRGAGIKWVPAFLAVYLISFLSEHIGTGYGFPFGHYEYTHLLGYKLGGRVPAVIPLSWFFMALPSWVLARAILPEGGSTLGRVILGSYFLTAWDLALDPAMSYLTPYWMWEASGIFYGMPWVNLLGWMGTGIVLMALLEAFGAGRWTQALSSRWLAAYYGVVLLMPLGMVVAAGLWWALAATLAALALPSAPLLLRDRMALSRPVFPLAREGAEG